MEPFKNAINRARIDDLANLFTRVDSTFDAAGFGGGFVFQHPDLAAQEWKLMARLTATTRGVFGSQVLLRSPGRVHGLVSAGATLGEADLYVGDQAQSFDYGTASVAAGAESLFSRP